MDSTNHRLGSTVPFTIKKPTSVYKWTCAVLTCFSQESTLCLIDSYHILYATLQVKVKRNSIGVEFHNIVLLCYPCWRRAWQPTPVFLPGESPWTEEPGGPQSMGLQRVGHDWATKHSAYYPWPLVEFNIFIWPYALEIDTDPVLPQSFSSVRDQLCSSHLVKPTSTKAVQNNVPLRCQGMGRAGRRRAVTVPTSEEYTLDDLSVNSIFLNKRED